MSKESAFLSKKDDVKTTYVSLDEFNRRELEINKLQEEKQMLINCLEFYANPYNWSFKDTHFLNGYGRPVISENDCTAVRNNGYDELYGGNNARQVLKKVGIYVYN